MTAVVLLLAGWAAGFQDETDRLIEKLRSEKVEEREEAFGKLRAMGEAAVPRLRKAAESPDLELAIRAKALLEPFGPAGTLQRIEASLARAKTLRVRVRVRQVTDAGEEETMVGLLSLKDPNRARLQLSPGHYWRESALLCNGTTLWDSLSKKSVAASPRVKECSSAGLARSGIDPTLFIAFGLGDLDGVSAKVDRWTELIQVDNVRFGPVEDGVPTLLYHVTPSPEGGLVSDAEMKLWYDAKTLRPVRRQKKTSTTVIEIYEDWAVDGELPDDLFKLPADRIEEQSRILAAEPRNSAAWAERAAASLDMGQWEESHRDYSRAIEFDPGSVRGLHGRGSLRMLLDRNDEALEDLDRAVSLAPKEARVRLDRGWVRVKLGRVREALEDFTVAVESDPRSLGAWIDRGVAWILLGDAAKALPEFDAAERIDPKWPTIYSNRALALAILGRADEAVVQAERALALNKHMPYYAFAARGLARLRKGEKAAALQEFRTFEEHAFKNDPLLPLFRKWKEEAELLK